MACIASVGPVYDRACVSILSAWSISACAFTADAQRQQSSLSSFRGALDLLLVHATDDVLVGLLDGDAVKLFIREQLSCLDREDFL